MIDLGLLAAVAMLVVWAVLTFVVNDAPGMTHSLLIAGVSLLVWRYVKRDAPAKPGTPPRP
jgi:hypothetical protein